VLARVLSALVGIVLAFAGANKVTGFAQWKSDAARQRVPRLVVFFLPGIELVLGAALVVFEPHPISLGLATLMLLIFTVYLAVQVAGKSQVPCACFGARSMRPPSMRDVGRNVLLLALLVAAAALS
jgi:hypothetical protein